MLCSSSVVVVVVLFDLTRSTFFPFLDATRLVVVLVVVVFVVVAVTRKTFLPSCDCPPGPSPNGGHPSCVLPSSSLSLSLSCSTRRFATPFFLDATRRVFVVVPRRRRLRRRRYHQKHVLPSSDCPPGPSPNGGHTSCVFALPYIMAQGSRLKTTVCRRTTFCLKFAFFQLRRRRCRPCRPRLDALLLRRLSFSFST